MCCQPRHHSFEACGHQSVCLCGCDDFSHYKPHFITKASKIAKLQQYLDNLQEEAKAVQEQIVQLKKQ